MKYLTQQQIFTRVAKHLLTQNAKSLIADDCQYRYRGKMCAVGCLIPDKAYKKSLEGTGIRGYTNNDIPGFPADLADGDVVALLDALQRVHDDAEVTSWPGCLVEIANRLKLSLAGLVRLIKQRTQEAACS